MTPTPALLTTTSTFRPLSARRTAEPLATSMTIASHAPPLPRTSPASVSSSGALRATAMRLQRAASRSAIARPMPRDAPVMRAVGCEPVMASCYARGVPYDPRGTTRPLSPCHPTRRRASSRLRHDKCEYDTPGIAWRACIYSLGRRSAMVKLPLRRLRRTGNGMPPRGGRHVDARESLVAQVGPAAVTRGGPRRAARDPAAYCRHTQGGRHSAAARPADHRGAADPPAGGHWPSDSPRAGRGDGHHRRHLGRPGDGIRPGQARAPHTARCLAGALVPRQPEWGQWQGAAYGAGPRDRSRSRRGLSIIALAALLWAVPAEAQRADDGRSTQTILLLPAGVYVALRTQAQEDCVVH